MIFYTDIRCGKKFVFKELGDSEYATLDEHTKHCPNAISMLGMRTVTYVPLEGEKIIRVVKED